VIGGEVDQDGLTANRMAEVGVSGTPLTEIASEHVVPQLVDDATHVAIGKDLGTADRRRAGTALSGSGRRLRRDCRA